MGHGLVHLIQGEFGHLSPRGGSGPRGPARRCARSRRADTSIGPEPRCRTASSRHKAARVGPRMPPIRTAARRAAPPARPPGPRLGSPPAAAGRGRRRSVRRARLLHLAAIFLLVAAHPDRRTRRRSGAQVRQGLALRPVATTRAAPIATPTGTPALPKAPVAPLTTRSRRQQTAGQQAAIGHQQRAERAPAARIGRVDGADGSGVLGRHAHLLGKRPVVVVTLQAKRFWPPAVRPCRMMSGATASSRERTVGSTTPSRRPRAASRRARPPAPGQRRRLPARSATPAGTAARR